MDSDFSNFMKEIWNYNPVIIILLAGGVIIFALLVIDTYRYRKKQKHKKCRKRLH
ncbi:MAG: hypothetical protein ACREFE_10125 [Limisphaerales bacterium]